MTSELNHILMAACLLIVAGIASFPYRLSYGNTAWLPRWMRPDRSYLDRPWEYDYPARGIGLLFSVMLALIGTLVLIFILAPDLPDDVPAERWFSALAVLYPAYASCQVLFWRKDYGDGFCYADRLTAFSHGKTDTILLTAAALFILHLTGVLPLSVYRIAVAVFSALCCLFLIHDYIHLRMYYPFWNPSTVPYGNTPCLPLPPCNQGRRTRTQRLPALLEAELS